MNITLIAICGTTPQIITETLYGLYEKQVFPNKVIILTTKKGKDQLIQSLFDTSQTYLKDLYNRFDVNPACIDFSEKSFFVACLPNGDCIDDISTEEDSQAFLDLCLHHVFMNSQAKDTQLIFSVAGGRKTMGAALALAAQCYGRKYDKAYHVLVSPEFELNPNFYYPTKEDNYISGRSIHDKTLNAREAVVTLVPMPFLSLRDHIPAHLIKEIHDPQELFEFFSPQINMEIRFKIKNSSIQISDKVCKLPPAQYTLFMYFIMQSLYHEQNRGKDIEQADEYFLEISDILAESKNIANLYRLVSKHNYDNSESGIVNLSAENFRASISKINKNLEQVFYEFAHVPMIRKIGKRPSVRYGVRLSSKNVQFVDVDLATLLLAFKT